MSQHSSAVRASDKNTGLMLPLGSSAPTEELQLVDALRRGEEAAFMELVARHHNSLLRLASFFVSNRAVAEEVVQETWLGVLQGISRFEGRSSLKTWISRILVNRARTRAQREGRMVAFSSLLPSEVESDEPALESSRFLGPQDSLPGHWALPPQSWGEDPEKKLLARETREQIQKAIRALPQGQRLVITLKDINGCTSEEVCSILGVSETNQRVLLHRARSRVRRELEKYFEKS
jgi:RNA polymerase sigma-70 factor (ECF subfamily)